jgi:hypothetical protein
VQTNTAYTILFSIVKRGVGAILIYAVLLSIFLIPQSLAAQPIPFEICAQSTTWVRPSPEVQAKIWNDARYSDMGRGAYEWTHDFLVSDPESASIPYHMENISGLWTARTNPGECHSAKKPHRSGLEWIEVWVLLHRVVQITHDDNRYTIIVEPVGRGFQSVLFHRLNPSIVLRFVTPDGRELERWDESAPPRQANNEVPSGTRIVGPNGEVIRK